MAAKLAEFLQTKQFSTACSICNTRSWVIPNEEKVSIPMVPEGGGFVVPAPTISAYVLLCSNCGHIVFFASAVVEARNG
jgi:hypothetical protein